MLKILVIEDDIIDQLTLKRLIKKNNLDCEITASMKIQEAISLMTNINYDLVICDLNLPDGRAFDLGALIKKQNFILLSGHLEQEIIDEALQLGAIQVLQKSSELTQLRSVINLIEQMSTASAIDSKKEMLPKANFKSSSNKFDLQPLLQIFNHQIEPVTATLNDFLNEKNKMKEEILLAKNSKDRDQIKFIAHKLKSRYALIGLKCQQQIAEQIESTYSNAPIVNLQSDLQKLNNTLEEIYPELEMALLQLKNKHS